MPRMKYLKELETLEITKFDMSQKYRDEGVLFTGTPRKHPYDRDKIVLVEFPFTAESIFYEFKIGDILHVEDRPVFATEHGETLKIVNIWIKKGTVGLRFQAFFV